MQCALVGDAPLLLRKGSDSCGRAASQPTGSHVVVGVGGRSRSCQAWGVKCQEDIPRPGLRERNQDVHTGMLMSGRNADPLNQRSASLWALPVVFSMDYSYVDVMRNACA